MAIQIFYYLNYIKPSHSILNERGHFIKNSYPQQDAARQQTMQIMEIVKPYFFSVYTEGAP